MKESWTSRTDLLLGEGASEVLKGKRVAVFGLGGVGGFSVEALARGGIGALDLIDSDTVSDSNRNRQILATVSNAGVPKTEAARDRVLSISPECRVTLHRTFVLPETIGMFDFRAFDYVLDCIDTVSGKIAIAEACSRAGTPLIMAMGAGNKLDPTRFEVTDVEHTSVCPLAKVMRRELSKRGIRHVKAVFSREEPVTTESTTDPESGKRIPGSVSFVPSVMGLIMAGEVLKDLTLRKGKRQEEGETFPASFTGGKKT